MTTGDAARVLGCLPITVRRRIERGELEGGQKPSGKWWLYADQLADQRRPQADERSLIAENAELRRQVDQLTATLATERTRWDARHRADRNRIAALLAVNAATVNAGEAYKTAAEASLTLVHRTTDVATNFKTAADEWMNVAGLHRDLMAAENVPDDPGQLEDLSR